MVDERFNIGPEVKWAYADEADDRGLHRPEMLVGPSIQWTPVKRMHIDWAFLVGCNDDSAKFKSIVIVGWEF